MRFARHLPAASAGLVLGTALWVSMGVMDQLPLDGRMTRVALLPSSLVWAAFVLSAVGVVVWLHRLVTARTPPDAHAQDWLLPLLTLAILAVPFLPGVADRWPVWQTLAGPLRWLVWTVVGGQLAWVAWQHGWISTPRRLASASPAAATAVVWMAVVLASGWSAWRLTSTPQFPTGDEPHYLVIAQSLWRDGDLKIENNHERGDYREYFGGTLPPHYLTRGVDGEIYSIHPIGMPVLITPVYAAGGYPLVVFAFVLIAATAATLMWRATAAWIGDRSQAVFGWAAVTFAAPFLLNTLTIYPEIPAALAVTLAFTLPARSAASGDPPHWRWLVAGIAVATLPWLSTKYVPMSAALVVVLIARAWTAWTPWPRVSPMRHAWRASAFVVVPYAVALAAWFAFFQIYWGTPWPSGPYGTLTQTTPLNLLFGAPGLVFDQEYGLLPYAPALFLAAPGLWRMLRGAPQERRIAVEILLVFGALAGTVGAFRIWWGGSAVVGRPLVSGLLLLMLPIAVQFASAPAGSARRAAQHLLVWAGVAITAVLVAAQGGALVGNHRDGTSSLLTWWSPGWELWSRVPTFVLGHTDIGAAWIQSLAWVAVAILAGWVLAGVRTRSAGTASLTALATLVAALLSAVSVVAWLPVPVAQPGVDLAGRHELAALDAVDRSRRPLALAYDPLRIVPVDDLTAGFVLSVHAGQRGDPQPVRLLHNGRFSLPAGRYEIEVRWTDAAERTGEVPVALQVGRSGAPWRSWTTAPVPGGRWSAEFTLPLSARLVGLRGSPDVERQIASIAVRALAVVHQSDRPSAPDVTGAATFDGVDVFFHDGVTHGEPLGFWALGARQTRLTISTPAAGAVVRLRLHSGDGPNRVTLATAGWHRTLDLIPGAAEDVVLPGSPDAVFPLTIDAEGGFVPAETQPGSDDRRRLGAWVEIGTD